MKKEVQEHEEIEKMVNSLKEDEIVYIIDNTKSQCLRKFCETIKDCKIDTLHKKIILYKELSQDIKDYLYYDKGDRLFSVGFDCDSEKMIDEMKNYIYIKGELFLDEEVEQGDFGSILARYNVLGFNLIKEN